MESEHMPVLSAFSRALNKRVVHCSCGWAEGDIFEFGEHLNEVDPLEVPGG